METIGQTLRIAHLSDLHLTYNQGEIWGVDTNANFLKTIDKLKNMNGIDCVIVTGDIADDGKIETYYYADKVFRQLGIETFWCYGNHDDVAIMNSLEDTFIKITNLANIKGNELIFLNSIAPDEDNPSKNRSSGIVDIEGLVSILASDCQPKIISLHHPSIEPGGWLSNRILINRKEFNDAIVGSNVRLVLCGHIHYHKSDCINGIIYTSAASTGFSFSPDLPKFQIKANAEGFSIITIKETIEIENIIL
jgi:Icc protein